MTATPQPRQATNALVIAMVGLAFIVMAVRLEVLAPGLTAGIIATALLAVGVRAAASNSRSPLTLGAGLLMLIAFAMAWGLI